MATTITANGINFPDGSASAPSIGGTDTNTGLFTGSDIVGFATGGVERIRIDANGVLKITGQTSSVETAGITHHTNNNLYIRGGTTGAILQSVDGNEAWIVQNDYVSASTNGSERLRITSNGRLLLNTADNSGYSNRSAYFTNPNDTWNYISITGAANGGAGIVFGDSTGQNAGNYESYMYHDNNSNDFYILTDQGNQRFTFDNNGHLGLGPNNTAPSGAIHINDSGQQTLVVGSTNAGGAYLVLDGDSNGDSAGSDYSYIGHTTNGDLELAVSNPSGNGNIYLKSNNFSYQAVTCHETGPVELRYQNGKRFETTSTGAILTSGAANTTSVRFGNTANRGLEIKTYQSAGNNDSGVVLNAADSENNAYAATLEFDLGGVEFGRFDGNYDIFKLSSACNGLTFNNGWADANRLDEYEEGSWTVTDLTSDGVTFTNQSNRYTRIGRQVFVQANIQFPNSGLSGAAMKMGGLPFTPGSGTTSSGIVSVAVNVSNGNGYANGVQLHIDTDGIHATYDGALRKGGFGNSQFQNRAVCFAFSYST